MSIKNFLNWILHLFAGNTPSCVLLGIEINSDKTCEDIRKAFDWVFFSTLLVVFMIMTYRLLKIIVTCTKILYFKYLMKSSKHISTNVCQTLIDELNVICDKHFYVWTKQTKSEVFDHFSKHKAKCQKCNNDLCFSNSFHNFVTNNKVKNPEDFEANELKLVFLNDKFNKKNGVYNKSQKKNERIIMKVNEWLAKQLHDYKEYEFERETRKQRRWCMKNNIVPIGNEAIENDSNAAEINCVMVPKHKEESQNIIENAITYDESINLDNDRNMDTMKSVETKESILDKQNIDKEIASNIDEIQSTLRHNREKPVNSSIIGNKKRKKLMKRSSLISNKPSNLCKTVLYIMPNKEYPLWVLQGAKQIKTTLKSKFGNINTKKCTLNYPNNSVISVALSDSYSNVPCDARSFYKNDRSHIKCGFKGPINTNKNILMINESEETTSSYDNGTLTNATRKQNSYGVYKKLMTNKVRNVKKAIEAELEKKKKNEENTIAYNKNECNSKHKDDTEATKNTIQRVSKIDNRNPSFETLLRQRPVLHVMSSQKLFNENFLSEENIPSGTDDVKKEKNLKLGSQYMNSDKSRFTGRTKLMPRNPFSANSSTPFRTTFSERYKNHICNKKNKTFKDEINYNLVNLPKAVRDSVTSRYKIFKIVNSSRKNRIYQTAKRRLGIIYEHSPWAL